MSTSKPVIKTVSAREFRGRLAEYLNGSEPIGLSNHGRLVGLYVPIAEQTLEEINKARAVILLERASEVLEDLGMNEEEVLLEFKEARRERAKRK